MYHTLLMSYHSYGFSRRAKYRADRDAPKLNKVGGGGGILKVCNPAHSSLTYWAGGRACMNTFGVQMCEANIGHPSHVMRCGTIIFNVEEASESL